MFRYLLVITKVTFLDIIKTEPSPSTRHRYMYTQGNILNSLFAASSTPCNEITACLRRTQSAFQFVHGASSWHYTPYEAGGEGTGNFLEHLATSSAFSAAVMYMYLDPRNPVARKPLFPAPPPERCRANRELSRILFFSSACAGSRQQQRRRRRAGPMWRLFLGACRAAPLYPDPAGHVSGKEAATRRHH